MQSRINRYRDLQNKRDYYAILGIDPNTPDDQVEELAKKNYKKLALQFHPDRCPDDKAGVVFKALTEARDLLTDTAQRKAYKNEAAKPAATQPAAYQPTYAPRARPQPGFHAAHAEPQQRQYPSVRVKFPRQNFFFVQPRVKQQDFLQAIIVMAMLDAILRAQQQRAAEQAFFVVLMSMQRNTHFCRADNLHNATGFEAPNQRRVRTR